MPQRHRPCPGLGLHVAMSDEGRRPRMERPFQLQEASAPPEGLELRPQAASLSGHLAPSSWT